MAPRTPRRRRKPRRVARLRKLGRAIDDVAAACPPVAVRLLMRSFIYPQRAAADERGAEVLARAEPGELPFGRVGLRTYRWSPARAAGDGPTVALFHDYEREAGYFADYVAPLLDKGCTVLALDAPASGASGGKRLSLREYVNAVHRLNARTGPWHTALGHGMGASALLQAAAQMLPAERPARIVTLAANADSGEAFASRLAALGVGEAVRRRFWRKLGKLREVPLAPYDNTRAAARLGDVRGLVLHDRADARTPLADAEAVAAAWPGARLEQLEGFGHDLRGTAVLRRVVPFLGARTALRELRPAA